MVQSESLTIHRCLVDQVFFEIIVECPGCPSIPYIKKNKKYALHGYAYILPRYRGTWESYGTFLKENPLNDIELILKALRKTITTQLGKIVDLRRIPIIIMASSLGGSIALSVDSRVISKKIILNPVISYRKLGERSGEESFDDFVKFIRTNYPRVYVVDKDISAEKMDFWLTPPLEQKAIALLIGLNDDQVDPKHTLAYMEKVKGEHKKILKLEEGHLSFNDLSDDLVFKLLED
jgi:esterase/lipase